LHTSIASQFNANGVALGLLNTVIATGLIGAVWTGFKLAVGKP